VSIVKQVTLELETMMELEGWARLDISPRGMGEFRLILSVIGDNEAQAQERLEAVRTALVNALQIGDEA